MTESLFISTVTHEDIKFDETKLTKATQVQDVTSETSTFNDAKVTVTEVQIEEARFEVKEETELLTEKEPSENNGSNNSNVNQDITRKESDESQHELTIEEIVSRLRNKGDEIGYKPIKRRRPAAPSKYIIEGEEWSVGDEEEEREVEDEGEKTESRDEGTEATERTSESSGVGESKQGKYLEDQVKPASDSPSSSSEEIDCKTDTAARGPIEEQIHVTSFAKLEKREKEVTKAGSVEMIKSNSVQFILTEGKSEPTKADGGLHIKEEKREDVKEESNKDNRPTKFAKDPRKMSIDEIVSSLPGARSLTEPTRSSSFGSGVRPFRKISEPTTPLARSQSFGSAFRNVSKPMKKKEIPTPKDSPVLPPKHASSQG